MFHSVLGKCWSSRERAIFFSPSFIFKTCVCIHTLTSARHTRMAHKGVALEPFFFSFPSAELFSLSLYFIVVYFYDAYSSSQSLAFNAPLFELARVICIFSLSLSFLREKKNLLELFIFIRILFRLSTFCRAQHWWWWLENKRPSDLFIFIRTVGRLFGNN